MPEMTCPACGEKVLMVCKTADTAIVNLGSHIKKNGHPCEGVIIKYADISAKHPTKWLEVPVWRRNGRGRWIPISTSPA